MISIKLSCNFTEITLRHGCSPVNLLHISRTSFTKNSSGRLLQLRAISSNFKYRNIIAITICFGITGIWNLPSNIDASTTWNGRNYFFKNCSFYAYEGNATHGKIAWEGDVRKVFKVPCNIDATVAWKDYVYFFKDERVWVWNDNELINSSSPINHWRIDGNLDAGFQWPNNEKTYLFKGPEYWVFDPSGMSIKHRVDNKWNQLLESSLLPNCACDCTVDLNSRKWKFVSLSYDITYGTISSLLGTVVGTQVVDNSKKNLHLTKVFTVSTQVNETQSFIHMFGRSLKVGSNFKYWIPSIVNGLIHTTEKRFHKFNYGKVNSSSKTHSKIYNCPSFDKMKVTCTATVQMQKLEVPYTMTVRHKNKGCKCNSKGVFQRSLFEKTYMSVKIGL